MLCVNCFSKNTRIINTRHKSSSANTWRRRRCAACSTTFTTYERPSLAENHIIVGSDGKKNTFNLGTLIISIGKAFAHDPKAAREESLWLAQTVEDTLSTQFAANDTISTDDIAAVCHSVLLAYDALAAVQYGAQHELITAVRRPGRRSVT